MTSVITKMEPIAIPGLQSGITTFVTTCQVFAPESMAASMTDRSILIILLKIGTIIKSEYKCTKASTIAKSENKRNSSGESIIPRLIRIELNTPFRPKKGIQDIILMIFDVQNGIVHTRNKTICHRNVLTWKHKKYAIGNPMTRVKIQVRMVYLNVLRYVL